MGIRLVANTMTDADLKRYRITSNGIPVRGCIWLDTDEGIAECAIMTPKYPLLTYDEETDTYTEYTYYLHNFEVWDGDRQIAIIR